MKQNRKYDPGTAQGIQHQSGSTFLVQSFRESGTVYTVNRKAGTCTCPHYTKRQPENGCKHLQAVEAALPRFAEEKAKKLSTADLSKHLMREDLAPGIKGAIANVLHRRVQAAVALAKAA